MRACFWIFLRNGPGVREKFCVVCGRRIEWRKKWEDCWDEVKYCSGKCRKKKVGPDDARLEEVILDLLRKRGQGKTICPSEAARELFPVCWREKMEDARMAGRRLIVAGKVVMTQGGKVVDASTAKGAVRLRLR